MADDTTTAEETEEGLKFDVKIEDAGPACKSLTITIAEDQIKDKIENSYGSLEDEAVVPGFRRGRAPRRLLEKRFADHVRDDVKNQLLSESYTQAIQDNDLDPLSDPQVDDAEKLELPDSGDLTFTVKVEITPDVELPKYDTLEVTKTLTKVADNDVDEEIERMCQQGGKPTTLEDAKIEEGDYAGVDVKIYEGENAGEDAELIQEIPLDYVMVNGESAEYKGHVAGIVVDDLGKQLTGKTGGDELTISMTGPAAHENEQIRDQPITLKLTVGSVHRIEPATTEAVIEQMGLGSEDELKERVKTMLEQKAEQNTQADLYQQLTDALVDKVDLELPKGITDQQASRVLQRQGMEMMYRGVPEEEVRAKLAEMRSESEEQAARQLKQFFILDKASKELEIDVDEQELNGRIAMMAMQQGRRPDKLRQEMAKQGQIEQLYLQLREQKTLDKILESAKVTEVEGEESAAKPKAKKKSTKKKTSKKTSKKTTTKKRDDE
ncbi:MAG: trigger factor [Phycisphaeraceae bacterium]|nr:trigger factor [Phycisphaeraceae bacterium]